MESSACRGTRSSAFDESAPIKRGKTMINLFRTLYLTVQSSQYSPWIERTLNTIDLENIVLDGEIVLVVELSFPFEVLFTSIAIAKRGLTLLNFTCKARTLQSMISTNVVVHLRCLSKIVPLVVRESFPRKTQPMSISSRTSKSSKTT